MHTSQIQAWFNVFHCLLSVEDLKLKEKLDKIVLFCVVLYCGVVVLRCFGVVVL
jgi:hypothetical protein